MSYDAADFRVQMQHGPVFGSFAAVVHTAAAKVSTSVNLTDRVEFFRNVKLLDFKVLPKNGLVSGHAATAHLTDVRFQLINGTNVIATAVYVATATSLGAMIDGGIRSGTFAEISSNSAIKLRMKFTGDATVETLTAGAIEAYLLYEHRFA
jgi:hypothetical protein